MKRTISKLLLMFLGSISSLYGQETFNVSYNNSFLFNGAGTGHTVFNYGGKTFVFCQLADSDSLGVGLRLTFNEDGGLIDTKKIDSAIDSLSVNAGRFNGVYFDEEEIFISPMVEFRYIDNDSIRYNRNSLIKMNLIGDTTKLIHHQVDSFRYNFFSVKYFNDNYFIVGQVIEANKFFIDDPDGAHGFLMKMDTLGNQVWVQHYENSWKIDYMDISEDGEFVLGAADFDLSGPFDNQHLIIKADSEGNEKWRILTGGDDNQELTPVEFNNTGNVIAAVANSDTGNGNIYPLRVIEIEDMETFGAIINDKEYDKVSDESNHSYTILENDIGEVFVGGTTYKDEIGQDPHRYGFLFKANASLDSIWYRTYTFYTESNRWHMIRDINFTEDGGFVMTGYAEEGTDATVPALDHIWTLKVDEHGCLEPGCEIVGTEEIVIGLQDAMNVFPNPVQDVLTIEWNIDPIRTPSVVEGQGSGFQMIILNSLGQIVQTEHLSPNDLSTHYQINLSTQARGLYTLHWTSGNIWFDSVKFVKE